MNKKLQPKTVCPYGYKSPFSSILFENLEGDRRYCYGPRYESSEVTGPASLSGIIDNADDKWFVCFTADCAFPPMFAVSADNVMDAYATFITECEHLVKIDEADLKDYITVNDDGTEDCSCDYNDNGTPVDAESIHVFEVRVVEARR